MKKKGFKFLGFAAFSVAFAIAYGNGKVVINPANIVSLFIASDNHVSMIVDAESSLDVYYPEACTNLMDGDWAHIPHSDDGVNAYVISNLAYSTAIGGGSDWYQIYLEAYEPEKFYRIAWEDVTVLPASFGEEAGEEVSEAVSAPASRRGRRGAVDDSFDTEPGVPPGVLSEIK